MLLGDCRRIPFQLQYEVTGRRFPHPESTQEFSALFRLIVAYYTQLGNRGSRKLFRTVGPMGPKETMMTDITRRDFVHNSLAAEVALGVTGVV
jgi:hypothetical protein